MKKVFDMNKNTKIYSLSVLLNKYDSILEYVHKEIHAYTKESSTQDALFGLVEIGSNYSSDRNKIIEYINTNILPNISEIEDYKVKDTDKVYFAYNDYKIIVIS